jgi:hypothetical protein
MARRHYAKLTDKELVRVLFPKNVRKQLKTALAGLNAKKPKRKSTKKR